MRHGYRRRRGAVAPPQIMARSLSNLTGEARMFACSNGGESLFQDICLLQRRRRASEKFVPFGCTRPLVVSTVLLLCREPHRRLLWRKVVGWYDPFFLVPGGLSSCSLVVIARFCFWYNSTDLLMIIIRTMCVYPHLFFRGSVCPVAKLSFLNKP